MALSHESYDFEGSTYYGVIQEGQPATLNIVRGEFMGVKGISHITDETKARPLSMEYMLEGYASLATLDAALQTIDRKAGKLTGTLTTGGDEIQTYEQCTFLGYERHKFKTLTSTGTAGAKWNAEGRLHWEQRKV